MEVTCNLTALLDERNLTLAELSRQTGISVVNLSVLKNGRARAIRFSTLVSICHALECNVGDLLSLTT